jgi:hypothetical protein
MIPLEPFDPLGSGFIAAGAFDDARQRFLVIGSDMKASQYRCGYVDIGGRVTECRLPPGFNVDIGYIYRNGETMRYREFDFKTKVERFLEVDLATGRIDELRDSVAIQSLVRGLVKIPITSESEECVANGAPLSPDGTVTVWQCSNIVECRGEEGKSGRLELPGVSARPFVSPASAAECAAVVDASASVPFETSSFVWSHDGSRIYWCGHGQDRGFVIDRRCAAAVEGPCLRGATWAGDDKTIIGVTHCGHEVTEWEVPVRAAPR